MNDARERAPYGRRRAADDAPPGSVARPQGAPRYDGTTYYDRPALKPSHWGWLIASYYFVGGLAGAAQVVATVADLTGGDRNRRVVSAGRYLALAGVLASPPFLIADLQTPGRFYNMLRIVRPTSPMSIGSWTLTGFGALSSLAAIAQAASDIGGGERGYRIARWLGVPAAAAGAVMAVYTGTLSTATSVPLWAAAPRQISALFGASSAASAIAALTLVAGRDKTGKPDARLEHLALLTSCAELALLLTTHLAWRRQKVDAPLNEQPLAASYNFGAIAFGAIVPIAIHIAQQATRRHTRPATVLASVATLAGVFIERVVIVFAGNASARRAQDYLRFTQPAQEVEPRDRGEMQGRVAR